MGGEGGEPHEKPAELLMTVDEVNSALWPKRKRKQKKREKTGCRRSSCSFPRSGRIG